MGNRKKYQDLNDLYFQGEAVEFPNGTVMWIAELNPYEMDDCREIAATARARMILALTEIGSDEQVRALAEFRMMSPEQAVNSLCAMQRNEWMRRVLIDIQDDADWTERLTILDRRDAILSAPPEDAERQLLDKVVADYFSEVETRQREEENFEREKLERMEQPALEERWLKLYRDQKGDAANVREFQFHQGWMAARCCEGIRKDDDTWDHSACDHLERAYSTVEEFKACPAEVKLLIYSTLYDFSMSVRSAKNSDSAPNSSGSSALQSPPEESTPSTPAATLVGAPGGSM